MHKRFLMIVFTVLLSTMSHGTNLKAMYIEGLWEDIWTEEQEKKDTLLGLWREFLQEESNFLNKDTVTQTLQFFSAIDCSCHTELIVSLHKFLTKVMEHHPLVFYQIIKRFGQKDLVFDQQNPFSVEALQDLLPLSLTDQIRNKLDKIIIRLKDDPRILGLLSGIVTRFLCSAYFAQSCQRSTEEIALEAIFFVFVTTIMREFCLYYQPGREVRNRFNDYRSIPYFLQIAYTFFYLCPGDLETNTTSL